MTIRIKKYIKGLLIIVLCVLFFTACSNEQGGNFLVQLESTANEQGQVLTRVNNNPNDGTEVKFSVLENGITLKEQSIRIPLFNFITHDIISSSAATSKDYKLYKVDEDGFSLGIKITTQNTPSTFWYEELQNEVFPDRSLTCVGSTDTGNVTFAKIYELIDFSNSTLTLSRQNEKGDYEQVKFLSGLTSWQAIISQDNGVIISNTKGEYFAKGIYKFEAKFSVVLLSSRVAGNDIKGEPLYIELNEIYDMFYIEVA